MSWSCPARVEEALWRATRDLLGDGPLSTARLRDAIRERSRLYTSERHRLRAPSDPDADLAARALFFTVADAPKVMVPSAELRARGLLASEPSIVDLGAGCGAMTWGAWTALGAPPGLRVSAIDRDSRALEIMQRAGAELGVYVRATETEVGREQDLGAADLVVVGSMLNELEDPGPLVSSWMRRLPANGALIIVEPALREVSRRLHRLRDRLIGEGFTIFAPCVRGIAPCPTLADERDWCHEDRPTNLPPRAGELAAMTGLRQHGMKFSYLVVRKDGARLVESAVPAARVVSRVRKLKGKWEGFLCSDAGRIRASLLRRHVSDETRDFTRLERGDVALGRIDGRIGDSDALRRLVPTDGDDDDNSNS